MALTHTQRTSMFNTLAEVMGNEDAETLMEHLPPSGWDNVATKDDLRTAFAETNAAIATGLAQAATERAEGFAQAAVERAEIRAEAATAWAEIIRRQAWHLYIVVSTIVLAAVSIWIALLTQPGPG
ncbi:MAG: hypothetical protein F4110_11960 [Acidimicrobiaceae bacterium]|nr:hypothetical protein [Acidimicrobiaceae bacterium]MXZ99632.1 hypothetical protein [Acidimicrobiaceae bacterium]MYE77093.1 hypothetical protein [Acidimicrobiaceae bacterium]MYE98356.1 hypothetical protein [Acidimicrobiaceae bacterium]MYH43050.1 hypothetical protein [Acidimicrobiaceae bacterium]